MPPANSDSEVEVGVVATVLCGVDVGFDDTATVFECGLKVEMVCREVVVLDSTAGVATCGETDGA